MKLLVHKCPNIIIRIPITYLCKITITFTYSDVYFSHHLSPIAISGWDGLGHLESRNLVKVHQFQHLLGISVHLNDALLQSRHLWHVVVTALTFLLLQLDGDASHWAALDSLHQVSHKSSNLVTKGL